MRNAVNQAGAAANQATDTGANYGAEASAVNAQMLPFLTRELNNPQGYSPQQTTSMLGAGMGGAGGSEAGVATEGNLNAARTRNSGGENALLDQANRDTGKANAGMSEGIAANSANLAQQHQQEAAQGLAGLGETDTNAQLKSMGLVAPDVNSEVNAGQSGWLQNTEGILKTIKSLATPGGGGS